MKSLKTARKFDSAEKRVQPENLESKHDAIKRLKLKKERTSKIKELKEEIHFKTGNEYFFKMNSLRQENDKLVRISKFDMAESKRRVISLNFEIIRMEKKLRKTMPVLKPAKIVFEDCPQGVKVECRQELKPDKERLATYRDYLAKLYKTKQQIEKMIENTKKQRGQR
ncbi:hypothetical protein VCUG_01433 [Vavraia culicis subsp. floridensis]|uniref:Uncharacterized protein n=1 Tax=Vavraia culicis (isolate floridensis) TaxID=948595 RepID=L2GUN2_VAVCU|nr:uncharacterized protein VCUG_01433 [Vavraia culicis subsp. floridensis]ELA47072.1 hypothetical protein VCUG_01433 [Vavraia culicis subsp. floridensis]